MNSDVQARKLEMEAAIERENEAIERRNQLEAEMLAADKKAHQALSGNSDMAQKLDAQDTLTVSKQKLRVANGELDAATQERVAATNAYEAAKRSRSYDPELEQRQLKNPYGHGIS